MVLCFTMQLKYLTSAYVTLRALRNSVNSSLPVEVFYAGNTRAPRGWLEQMEAEFTDVRFIDIYQRRGVDFPTTLELEGYQLKFFAIMLSSFEEVLFLDADNIPVVDPTFAFELEQYVATGALVWPDLCNMVSITAKTWDAFGIKPPVNFPADTGKLWRERCSDYEPREIQGGEFLINKRRTWPGLVLTTLISWNHQYALTALFASEKQSMQFGFNATGTTYAVAPLQPYGVGLSTAIASGKRFLFLNTLAQRHPQHGRIVWLHRILSKFFAPKDFLNHPTAFRMWTHMATQDRLEPWVFLNRSAVPDECLHPNAQIQPWSAFPRQSSVIIHTVPDNVGQLLMCVSLCPDVICRSLCWSRIAFAFFMNSHGSTLCRQTPPTAVVTKHTSVCSDAMIVREIKTRCASARNTTCYHSTAYPHQKDLSPLQSRWCLGMNAYLVSSRRYWMQFCSTRIIFAHEHEI